MEQLVRDMLRQASAERAVIEFFAAFDRRDWVRVQQALGETVDFEMVSTGRTAGEVDAEGLVAGWRARLASLDAVHHQIGSLRTAVYDDEARVACHGVVHHYRSGAPGGATRRFVGTYDLGLRNSSRGWQIHTLRFAVKFVEGNPDLT